MESEYNKSDNATYSLPTGCVVWMSAFKMSLDLPGKTGCKGTQRTLLLLTAMLHDVLLQVVKCLVTEMYCMYSGLRNSYTHHSSPDKSNGKQAKTE